MAGVRLRPVDAVTITRELALRASRGELPGVPSPHVVRFTEAGEILIEGPIAAGKSVDRAARLLDAMLPAFDAPSELRVPDALRFVLARASRMFDGPSYPTLESFADALERFAAPDAAALVREIVGGWCGAVAANEPKEPVADGPATVEKLLTVSDVRRARRATGLTLAEIAERSRIPVSLLRELEWGYFANWPAGHYGRTQLVRYARAAGLDDQVVMKAVLHELEAAESARHAGMAIPLLGYQAQEQTAAPSMDLVRIEHAHPVPMRSDSRRSSRWLAALAIPALLVLGLIPAFWQSADLTTAAPNDAQPGMHQIARDAVAVSDRAAAPRNVKRDAHTSEVAQPPRGSAQIPVRSADARLASLHADGAFSPAFATVGSAMFYHADESGPGALMRADTDSSGAVLRITRVVDDASQNFHARPSPDGRWIAFDSDRGGERAVYVAEASGRNVRRITGDGFAAVPSWSPDGRQIAYVRAEPDRPHVWNLWVTDLESGSEQRVTAHLMGQPWGAAWFPDGGSIAYSHEDTLIVRELGDNAERVYPSPRKGRLLRTPAVSPDGKRIVFQVDRDGAWLLDVADGSMRKILSDPTAEEFTWSPDGRRIAYHSRKTGQWGVWIMAAR